MATKLRLQRHGRKNYAFYHIVAADVRAPRDGKFIDRVGSYNPNTNPATVQLNFEAALKWVLNGAQPTQTVKNILSDEGFNRVKLISFTPEVGAIFAGYKESGIEIVDIIKNNINISYINKSL